MAKLKVSGSASGTGTITLIAPATSTDRTITLPDESITLGGGVDGIVSTADATAITIDSNENVGFGTTTPSRPIHYSGSGSDNSIVRIECTDNNVAGIELMSGHGNWGVYNSDTIGDALEFRDDSAGTTRLALTSDGRGLSPFTAFA